MRRAIGLLALALVALLPWAPAEAQAPKEVVIGVLYPLSGPVAQVGVDAVNAVKMVVEIINNGGSIRSSRAARVQGAPSALPRIRSAARDLRGVVRRCAVCSSRRR